MRVQETQKTEENERGVDLNINIYYGGRGIIDDPTIYVINKMQEVLEELRVHVERYNLYDGKTNITTLPQTLKEADGIILATTVEWYGIGGYMQQFLDACWLYGDKETIAGIYMCPVVMSTTYGEREGKLSLAAAWEILGGLPCSGICGYIENTVTLEMNGQYGQIIEKKAENMYRTINQKIASFPASNKVNAPIMVDDTEYHMTCVSMGNPHAIVFMEGVKDLDIEKIGPKFEHHTCFPNRTNTEFVEILDRKNVFMRVWERGTGETLACGTGCCATAVACVLNGLTDEEITVKLLGGELHIKWDRKENLVYMTGPAKIVFEGEVDPYSI